MRTLFQTLHFQLFLLGKTNRLNVVYESRQFELIHHLSDAIELRQRPELLGSPINDPLNSDQ